MREAGQRTGRFRAGDGARSDSDLAPSGDLLLARRGTAFFARLLNDLPDPELYQDSCVPGWQRCHVVASVGLHARELANEIEAIRTGTPVVKLSGSVLPELREYATIPARALRHLFSHSAVHLNVVWRDLSDAEWKMSNAEKLISHTPLERGKVIWEAALNINTSVSASIFPADVKRILHN
ncbi:maleylpyruvate isomerase N-terminal domain-containing protein [Phaeobacter gallaeciensis]|uniref:maleylpyruvate isomerase N-terminal domain-containing protein n=1 Tax=Phaeobacter gallaeciensis TaxID=60890 RepID=UPI000BBCAB0D|nr:maleylpyruvate isomerase N-terminal domain-containing protein [Phaeobacter gallaeciensis]ATF20598.1 Mycothiol maleylpyruvate isomerase [Phaeobacter gallaeciensis]ATF24707.1 Mycothiol maleylpyruvate isomerase [Phaeobacter gallaeciensis]